MEMQNDTWFFEKQFGSFLKSYTHPHKDLYMNQVHVHSSTIHNSRKLDNPSTGEMINKMHYIHTSGYIQQ